MSWGGDAVPQSLRDGLSARRISGFDGIRALAVIVILLTHMKLIPGFVALNVFFGLSGFLITWLLLEEERRAGRVSLRHFYWRRTLRIFPAYYVALVVVVWLVPPSLGPLDSGHVQSAALYYSNYYQAFHGATHGTLSPYWSLAMEEQFYLLWPVLFFLAGRRREQLLWLLIVAVWGQRAVVCWVEGRWEWAYHALDCRADHLLVGCLFAVILHRGGSAWLWSALCVGRRRLWLSMLLLLGLTLIPLVWGKPYRLGLAFYVEPWVIACILLQVVALRAQGRLQWLDAPPLVWIGERSYAIYLYHVFAMDLVGRVLPGSPFVSALPVFITSVVFAELSWRLIEVPAQRLRRWPASASSPPPGASGS